MSENKYHKGTRLEALGGLLEKVHSSKARSCGCRSKKPLSERFPKQCCLKHLARLYGQTFRFRLGPRTVGQILFHLQLSYRILAVVVGRSSWSLQQIRSCGSQQEITVQKQDPDTLQQPPRITKDQKPQDEMGQKLKFGLLETGM